MEIKCRSFTCHVEAQSSDTTTVLVLNEAMHDLALEEIIHEKGISFVLNSIGEQAIAEYFRQQGFHVLDNAFEDSKVA